MESATDILELKFEGNGITPSAVKPSEIGILIFEFEKALLSTIKRSHPEIDTGFVLFSFQSIKHESIGLNFITDNLKISPEIKKLVLSSYFLLTTSIRNNDFHDLSNETITSLKQIAKFSKKYNCIANFNYNGENLSSLSPGVELKENKPIYLKGDTTIYGQLIDVGGEHPNIHIKVNENYIIIIDTDKAIAKKLGARLFDTIGLKGNAKWDAVTSEIIEFKLYDILDYTAGNIAQSFLDLKKITSGVWDNYNTNDEINNQLLRD